MPLTDEQAAEVRAFAERLKAKQAAKEAASVQARLATSHASDEVTTAFQASAGDGGPLERVDTGVLAGPEASATVPHLPAARRPRALKKKGKRGGGFASMDKAKLKAACSKGGKTAQALGKAHVWDATEARAAGQRGGRTVSEDREHMRTIGARGGATKRAQCLAAQNAVTPVTP